MAQVTNKHTDAAIRLLTMLNDGHEPYAPAVGAVQQWLADYDDALRAQLAQAERERDEAVARWNATAGASQRDLDAALVEQRRYSFALAAAEARERELREALTALTACVGYAQAKARYGPLFGNKCTPAIRAADAALSRPPGSREALREMLTKCALAVMDDDRVDYRGDDDAAPVCVAAAIVARLVPDAGQKGAEG